MDITRAVTYRGLRLTGAAGGPGGSNPIQGIRLVRVRYGDVSVHGYTEKKSLEDGFDASDVFMGQRQVTLEGEVFARSKGGLFDLLDAVRLTFTPTDAYNQDPRRRGYLPLIFEQPTMFTVHWPDGVIEREMHVRPSAQPEFLIQFAQMGESENGGYACPFTARLEARDPRFYSTTDTTHALTGTGEEGAAIRNKGNYPAPADIVLSTNTAGQKTFTLVGMGSNMTVKVPDGAGTRTVYVDGHDKVATLIIGTTETLRMDLITLTADTTWPKVMPTPEGAPDVEFDWTWTGGGLMAGSRVAFRDTWA